MKNVLLLFYLFFVITSNAQDNFLQERHFPPNLIELMNSPYSWSHTFCGIPIVKDELLAHNNWTVEDSLIFSKYEVKDLDYTLDILVEPETNLVVISEHHTIVKSRQVIYELVESLIEKGFTRVYVEAIHFVDRNLNERGYPVAETGFMICEPNFGELIRLLLDANIEVLPYEERSEQLTVSEIGVKRHIKESLVLESLSNISADPMQSALEKQNMKLSIRDYSQYKNIMKSYDPDVKSIIICGHGHGKKIPYAGWLTVAYWMGRHLEVNMVSIETSGAIAQLDDPMNRLMQLFDQKKPFVLRDKKTEAFYAERQYDPIIKMKVDGLWDVSILYPRNAFDLSSNDSYLGSKFKQEIDLSDVDIGIPFVLYSFLESEMQSEYPIPTSARFYERKPDLVSVYMRKEGEVVILWDGKNKIVVDR